MRRAAALLLTAALAGCPGEADDPEGEGATSPSPSPTEDAEAGDGEQAPQDEPAADPLEGSVFDRAELFAIYRADVAGDPEERRRVLREHRLLDASGQENAARVAAYERALQRYAEADPEGWSELVETLPR